VAFRHRSYRPFSEARSFVHTLGLRNEAQWRKYRKSRTKPVDVPARPDVVYPNEWRGMGDWLGTGTLRTQDREYRPFIEARAFVRSLHFRNEADWRVYRTSPDKPANVPARPEAVYATEWQGMGDWLGVVNKWTKHALLAFLEDLRPQLPNLDERELYVVLQQGGQWPALRAAFGSQSPGALLRDLKRNDGRVLEEAIRGVSDETMQAEAQEYVHPDLVPTEGVPEEVRPEQVSQERLGLAGEPAEHLPNLATIEGLRAVDQLADLRYGLDDEAAEYLVANRVSALWDRYLNKGREPVAALLGGEGGRWFTEIKTRFLTEMEGVESLSIPTGWSFTVNNLPAPPNAMQRRAAYAVRQKRRVGNWSGVGSGKTLSAVLASRVADARVTLVVTNNATVEQWKDQIERAYPDSVVHTHVDQNLRLNRNRHNHVVLNYEKFQVASRSQLVRALLGLRPDFVVFDEVQFVKQRDERASRRRKALEAFVSQAAQQNPALRVLGMSATPVINNLLEARKLVEITVGTEFADLDTQPTVNNGLAVHRALMVHGFRYRPPYEQEMHTTPVEVVRNNLLEPLRAAHGNILSMEQVLLPAKLEAAGPYFRKGTLVYTHYVQGMVPVIRQHLERRGFRVGLYTGVDKSGLPGFLSGSSDILVASRPVGTGLDGLQTVCDQLVFLCLPWTNAEYEQIVGRIRRQGSAFSAVEIIVPQVLLQYDGDTRSWDQDRLSLLRYKQTLSDCALDGAIPETIRINPNELLKRSREALDRWIARVSEKGVLFIEREQLVVPLPPDVRRAALVRHGDFSVLNQRWSASRSSTTHERLQQEPSEWYLYHTLYREARASWPEQPVEHIAGSIRRRPDWVIGDFGCGECLLRGVLPNRVIGLDHVAWDAEVAVCDMRATPLENEGLDAAVFSLSLMGTNWADYLKEAYRTLKPYGHLFIAEPLHKWRDRLAELREAVEAAGFQIVGDPEQRYGFLYVTAVKA